MSTSPSRGAGACTPAASRRRVSEDEWRVRVDLAAAYRLTALFRWDDLIFTHITARVPGTVDQFLINPYGSMFEEVTASSLVRIDLHGNQLDDSPCAVNPAGFTIHSALHAARHDAGCVMHTHSLNGVAVSTQRGGVRPLSQHALLVLPSLAYHDYEGIALRDDEKPRLVRDLGNADFLMLRNHGLLTLGATVADAWMNMYVFETVCTIQVRAQGSGEPTEVPEPILATGRQQVMQSTQGVGPAALAWPGLLRRLDRSMPGYDT